MRDLPGYVPPSVASLVLMYALTYSLPTAMLAGVLSGIAYTLGRLDKK